MYERSDRTIRLLNKRAIRHFQASKRSVLAMDELNAMEAAKDLYDKLEDDNIKAFLDLAQKEYKETKPNGGKMPSRKWLMGFLSEVDPVTRYIYLHEVTRKMAYFAESISASGGNSTDFRRALSYWARMTAHYSDAVNDASVLKAYQDAGVAKVRWITQEDDRVCEECRERDQKIFPIDKVPDKPHWGCRCYLEAILNDEGSDSED